MSSGLIFLTRVSCIHCVIRFRVMGLASELDNIHTATPLCIEVCCVLRPEVVQVGLVRSFTCDELEPDALCVDGAQPVPRLSNRKVPVQITVSKIAAKRQPVQIELIT
jgi:hypothetical protein